MQLFFFLSHKYLNTPCLIKIPALFDSTHLFITLRSFHRHCIRNLLDIYLRIFQGESPGYKLPEDNGAAVLVCK